MRKLSTDLILAARITETFKRLYNTTSKLHKATSSIKFIKKVLYNKVTPSFGQISGQFIDKQDQIHAEQNLTLLLQTYFEIKRTNKHIYLTRREIIR